MTSCDIFMSLLLHVPSQAAASLTTPSRIAVLVNNLTCCHDSTPLLHTALYHSIPMLMEHPRFKQEPRASRAESRFQPVSPSGDSTAPKPSPGSVLSLSATNTTVIGLQTKEWAWYLFTSCLASLPHPLFSKLLSLCSFLSLPLRHEPNEPRQRRPSICPYL